MPRRSGSSRDARPRPPLQRRSQLALQGDELGQVGRADASGRARVDVERPVERATEADIEGQRAARVVRPSRRARARTRDVPEADRLDPAVAHGAPCRPADRSARPTVDATDRASGSPPRARSRSPTSRARSSRARRPSSSPRCGRTRRRGRRRRRRAGSRSRRTCRRGRAARGPAAAGPRRGAPLAQRRRSSDRVALEGRDAAGDDPERLAAGVVVGRLDRAGRARRARRVTSSARRGPQPRLDAPATPRRARCRTPSRGSSRRA